MGGTRLRLRVVPGAAKPGVVGRHGDAWKLRVREAPDRGRANDAVLDLLAGTLAVPRRDLRLVSGHGARDKVVELAGITAEEINRRLAAAEQEGTR
ncbi:MAG: DUF167 domain-containing protein [Actinomycetota bacterium]|nr:DUF167 domain-containing protein [Actinomycetota bacterium]